VSGDRQKEIVRNLSEEDLGWLLLEADDSKAVRRLTLVKNLYKRDSLEETADRVGKVKPTESRWHVDGTKISTSQSRLVRMSAC